MKARKPVNRTATRKQMTQFESMQHCVLRALGRVDVKAPALDQLRELRILRDQVERALTAGAKQARADSGTWSEIGAALGMSPQGAQKKAQIQGIA
jgi:hypothetical protein